jgi:hypothetical protein
MTLFTSRTFFIATASLLWIGGSAWALSVSPGRTQIALSPGAKMNASLTVRNDAQKEIQVQVSKKDWFVLPANKDLTIDKWLTVRGPQTFFLKPGQARQVKLTARCPKQAQGELVGMVSFLYQTEDASMVTPVISVSVYLSAAGTEKVEGAIKHLVVRHWRDSLQVAVGVESTGNVHLRPTGHVRIFDAKGASLIELPIKEGDPAYPGMERGYFAQEASRKLAPGHYRVEADLVYRDLPLKATRQFSVGKDGNIKVEGETI